RFNVLVHTLSLHQTLLHFLWIRFNSFKIFGKGTCNNLKALLIRIKLLTMNVRMDPDVLKEVRSGKLPTLEANVLDGTTPEGNTILHVAARFGYKLLVEKIINQRPSLAFKSNDKGETPVHVAARAGEHDVVEVFINSVEKYPGIHIGSIRDKFGNTPLHGAVRNGQRKVINALAQKDSESLLWINDAGESPLSIAIDMRLTDIAQTIIDLNDSTLDYRGNKGQTPLHCAVMRQDFDIMRTIIHKKKDLVGVPDESKRTPLHYAAALGHQKMVQELIKQHPLIAYEKDKNDQTPLHLAAATGQVRLMEGLLEPCPDTIEIVDDMQQNILHIAAKHGNMDAVLYILELPEMEDLINSPDVAGNTPLHLAVSNYHSDVVDVLSKNPKVEIRSINNSGNTALAIATLPDDRGMELQKHLTLKALKSAYKQKVINLEDFPENTRLIDANVEKPKSDDKIDAKVEKPKSDDKKIREMGQIISVMSTLIATFTFTAAFTIPGGFKSDGPDKGLAMLISKSAFRAFVLSDAIAMTSSITAAVIVFWSNSRRDTESFLDTLPFAIGLTWISLIAMTLAFVTGLFVVLQKTLWLAILVCVIGCAPPFLLYIYSPIYLLLFERISKSRTSLSNRQNIIEDNPFLFTVRLMKIFFESQIFKCLCSRRKSSCCYKPNQDFTVSAV
ncbi:protein ACCELERATED CELL DEATH 6-like, partial [Herrania umbratica]|uniref:Protein ACCELERATED CELL DEATH 6-like n=1 Tax=Herrania umbratica TaxID=108875 RepID=A0A6J1ALB5_9ROSI